MNNLSSDRDANKLLSSLKKEFGQIMNVTDGEITNTLEGENAINSIKTHTTKILSILEEFEVVLNTINKKLNEHDGFDDFHMHEPPNPLLKRLSTAKSFRLMPDVADDGSVRPSGLNLNLQLENIVADREYESQDFETASGMHFIRGPSLLSINFDSNTLQQTIHNNTQTRNSTTMGHDNNRLSVNNINSNINMNGISNINHRHMKSSASQTAILTDENGDALVPSLIVTTVNDDSDVWICPKYEFTLIEDVLQIDDSLYDDIDTFSEDQVEEDINDDTRADTPELERSSSDYKYRSLSKYKREAWKYMLKAKDLREQEFDEFWEKQINIAYRIEDIIVENKEIKKEMNQLKKSKWNLINTTSNEMENLRNIIKFLNNQIVTTTNNNNNGTTKGKGSTTTGRKKNNNMSKRNLSM